MPTVRFAGHAWEVATRSEARKARQVLAAHAATGNPCDAETLGRLVDLVLATPGLRVPTILERFRREEAERVPASG